MNTLSILQTKVVVANGNRRVIHAVTLF